MKPFVEITQVKKKIDNFHLGPINLTIEPGTITSLVGNNGSGKSTLMKLMMNLANTDSGSINLFNQNVSGDEEQWKSFVSYQSQKMIGWDAFTGENLKCFIAPLYEHWDEQLFQRIVEHFAIPLNQRFSKLSQGSQQKLTLALTIPRNTPLILLDEPTAYLDIPAKTHLMDILVEWMDQGERSIIIASHQIEDIKKLSDYLFVLRNGEMVGNFEKEALTERYKRYWLRSELTESSIPGEVFRDRVQVVSNHPKETEHYLREKGLQWTNQSSLDLEEIITLLLSPTR